MLSAVLIKTMSLHLFFFLKKIRIPVPTYVRVQYKGKRDIYWCNTITIISPFWTFCRRGIRVEQDVSYIVVKEVPCKSLKFMRLVKKIRNIITTLNTGARAGPPRASRDRNRGRRARARARGTDGRRDATRDARVEILHSVGATPIIMPSSLGGNIQSPGHHYLPARAHASSLLLPKPQPQLPRPLLSVPIPPASA